MYMYLFFNWERVREPRVCGQREEWGKGLPFNEAESSHGAFRLKKKKCWFYMPKSWKEPDGLRLWCIFPDGRCHFVFCINWLNLLALCAYFRGHHSLLSMGQKSPLAPEPSSSMREAWRTVLRRCRRAQSFLPTDHGKSSGRGLAAPWP